MTLAVDDTFSWASLGTGYPHWNRFAAVNDEFVPIHMDDDEGRKAGYPSSIAMGRLLWSYLHRLLRDELPKGSRILAVSMQFRAPALRNVAFTVTARVTVVRDDDADLDASIVDGDGRQLASGTATVAVSRQR